MSCRSIISVDVEDYFHVEAFAGMIPRASWGDYECRVERNTERILDLLDDCRITATFFILGWVAERYPALVRKIAERGHEPACHSYWHRLIYKLTPRNSAKTRSRQECDRASRRHRRSTATARPVFPSPAVPHGRWMFWPSLDSSYDSSVFPVRHDVYGVPDAPRGPFRVETPFGPIVEFPMATFRWSVGPNLPVGGGGYLRMLPYWYTKAGVQRAWREGLPVVSYVHPWELDPEQPRLTGPLKSRLRHYTNLKGAETRLRKLLALDEFSSFRDSGLARIRSRVFVQGSDSRMKQDNMPQVARFWNTIAEEFDAIYTGANKSWVEPVPGQIFSQGYLSAVRLGDAKVRRCPRQNDLRYRMRLGTIRHRIRQARRSSRHRSGCGSGHAEAGPGPGGARRRRPTNATLR